MQVLWKLLLYNFYITVLLYNFYITEVYIIDEYRLYDKTEGSLGFRLYKHLCVKHKGV